MNNLGPAALGLFLLSTCGARFTRGVSQEQTVFNLGGKVPVVQRSVKLSAKEVEAPRVVLHTRTLQ